MATSRQIEAMCRTSPPSKVVPKKATASAQGKTALVENLAKGCMPANPILNYQDIPEASSKKKVDLCVLDAIAEASVDCELDLQAEDQVLDTNYQWACHACTFVNHDLLVQCEMCNTTRDASLQKNLEKVIEQTDMSVSLNDDEWPCLEEASSDWKMCDVSSIASSWLEVACTNDDEFDEELEDVIVIPNVQEGEGKSASWSQRVGMVSNGSVAKAPAAGALMPRLWHKQVVQKRCKHDDTAEEHNWELEELEVRRLRPHVSRGSMERHRLRKR